MKNGGGPLEMTSRKKRREKKKEKKEKKKKKKRMSASVSPYNSANEKLST